MLPVQTQAGDPFAESPANPTSDAEQQEATSVGRHQEAIGVAPNLDVSVVNDVSFERLHELIWEEAAQAPCDLKDVNWANPTCGACPEQGSHGQLCVIGIEQERIVGGLGTSTHPD